MKRSIVKQGAATLMVSLPSKWTKKYHLNKGDEVDVIEKGKDLLIASEAVQEIRKARVNLPEIKKIWKRVLSALYKAGYDEIEIGFEKPEEISKIYSILNEFIGFEIVGQTEKGCTIKEIVEAKETNFNTIVSRTFSMLISIADDCANALKNKNTEILGTIPERDLIINKYTNFCRRLINKDLVATEDAPMLYYIIEALETLGDIYKSLAKYAYETKTVPNKKAIQILEEINQMISEFHLLINKFEKETAVIFPEKWNKLDKELNELLKTKSVSEIIIINHLSEMLVLLDHLMGVYLTLNSDCL